MIIDWLRSNHWLNFRKRDVLDTSWFQRQMLKKKYQDKKQDQSYKNQAEINRPPVKTRLAKNANSNLISFVPKNSGIRKIKKA